jgi:hypothetical protein
MQIPLLEIFHDSFLGASMCFYLDNHSLILMTTSLKIELRRCNRTSLILINGTRTRVVFLNWYWFATNLLHVGKCTQGFFTSSIRHLKAKKWLPDLCHTHYSVEKKNLVHYYHLFNRHPNDVHCKLTLHRINLQGLNLHNISNLYFKLQLKYFNLHRNNIQLRAIIKYTTLITYILKFLLFIKNKIYKNLPWVYELFHLLTTYLKGIK